MRKTHKLSDPNMIVEPEPKILTCDGCYGPRIGGNRREWGWAFIRTDYCRNCVRGKRPKSTAFWSPYDMYITKEEYIHERAQRRGLGNVVNDDGGRKSVRGGNGPSYTKRDQRRLRKKVRNYSHNEGRSRIKLIKN